MKIIKSNSLGRWGEIIIQSCWSLIGWQQIRSLLCPCRYPTKSKPISFTIPDDYFFPVSILLNLLLLVIILLPNPVIADIRVALVIGNAEYKNAPLTNPVNDAIDISQMLQQTGFEVDYYSNINRKQMREAIRIFGEKLSRADTGLFYFAGHGIQIKGRNYLIPLEVDVISADEVQDESIDASSVLRKMESAGNSTNIIILDACRNNPFARSFRSLDRGLARMDGPIGSYIAYATAPGSVAADGVGRNGIYTQHLLDALRMPGLTIEQIFKRVRNGVIKDTARKQIPWESSSLTGEFIFRPILNGVTEIQPVTVPTPAPPIALKFLQVIANVPQANVMVNNVNRGLTGDKGALNIANLTENEVEVIVQAKGYIAQTQRIKLKDGQWEQLFVTLQPIQQVEPVQSKNRLKDQKTFDEILACVANKRVLLNSQMTFEQTNTEKIKRNVPFLKSIMRQTFSRYGMNFMDESLINQSMLNKKRGERVLKALAAKYHVHYLLKADINIREIPIKLIKTNMMTVNVDVTLELLGLKSNRVLASVSRMFNRAGLDSKHVAQKQLKKHLPEMSHELIQQACNH